MTAMFSKEAKALIREVRAAATAALTYLHETGTPTTDDSYLQTFAEASAIARHLELEAPTMAVIAHRLLVSGLIKALNQGGLADLPIVRLLDALWNLLYVTGWEINNGRYVRRQTVGGQ